MGTDTFIERLGEIADVGNYGQNIADYVPKPEPDLSTVEGLVSEIMPIAELLGEAPKRKDLKELERPELIRAITKAVHNDLYAALAVAVLEKGYEMPKPEEWAKKEKKPFGYWTNMTNVIYELTLIIEDEEQFPSSLALIRERSPDLANCIVRYHGNIELLKTRMLPALQNSDNPEHKKLLSHLK